MPLTKKGRKILRSMRKQYGSEEKAKEVFYASVNAGKITGAHKTDARRGTKITQRDPFGREASTYAEEEDALRLDACKPDDDPDDDDDEDEDDDVDEEIDDAQGSSAHRSLLQELKRPREGAAWKDPENAEHVSNYETLARAAHEVPRHSRSRAASMLIELTHVRKRIETDAAPIKKRDRALLGASTMIPTLTVLNDVQHGIALTLHDAFVLDKAANVHYTADGYLAANPRIARTGIQIYGGDEVGRPELELVRVLRPESEVFAPDAVSTYAHLPVTDEHPKQMLNAKNWAEYVKGETGDEILRDGKAVRIPMMLRDAATIQGFKDGKNQLSVGYICDLDWSSGKTDDGEAYDCIQRNIRANHLAVVPAARGGPELKIGDGSDPVQRTHDRAAEYERQLYARAKDSFLSKGEPHMSFKAVQIDGITVEMSDTAAQVVNQALARAAAAMDAFKKKEKDDEDECEDARTKLDAANTVLKTKDAEIATLKQQLKEAEMTPVRLDGLVKDRANVIDKARKVMGSTLVVDGRTIEDIRRQVVEARLGSSANGWGDGEVKASFDTLTAGKTSNPVQDAVTAFGRPGFVDVDPREAAYRQYDEEMSNAWRGQAKTA